MNRCGSVCRWTKDNSLATFKNSKKFVTTDIRKVLEFVQKELTQLDLEGQMPEMKKPPSVELQNFQWVIRPVSIKMPY